MSRKSKGPKGDDLKPGSKKPKDGGLKPGEMFDGSDREFYLGPEFNRLVAECFRPELCSYTRQCFYRKTGRASASVEDIVDDILTKFFTPSNNLNLIDEMLKLKTASKRREYFKSYLMKACNNRVINKGRDAATQKKRSVSLDEWKIEVPGGGNLQQKLELDEAKGRLTPTEQMIVSLRFEEGMGFRGIEDQFGGKYSISSLKRRCRRALIKLRWTLGHKPGSARRCEPEHVRALSSKEDDSDE